MPRRDDALDVTPPTGGPGSEREREPEAGPARSSLAEKAHLVLRAGPLHTLQLARAVLGLEGHAGASSAAIYTLLGTDRRFRVDPSGVWYVCDAERPVGPSLQSLSYAVVDVETTGGPFGSRHRIIEIAMVEVAEGCIVGEYQTLVNPGCAVSPSVYRLTGITNEMVTGAPYFDDIAGEVLARLRGRVFVAHNARFDWSVLSSQLAASIAEVPDVVVLCTLRITRRLLPGLRRRSLEAVAAHYGIEIHDRHRAFGDALATARILLRLLDEASLQGLHDMVALRQFLSGEPVGHVPRIEARP